MRIGERLVSEGVISRDLLERALRQQVVQGARLGTNLVELGCILLDDLANALGRHHGMRVALREHFRHSDKGLRARVSPQLAARWFAIPLMEVDGHAAVGVMDPLPPDAEEQLAAALGMPVVACVAAELRIHYYLERIYGVPRHNRFLRVRPTPTAGMPALADPDPERSEADLADPPSKPRHERRRFVRTLSDVDSSESIDAVPDVDDLADRCEDAVDAAVAEAEAALGRIAIKTVAVGNGGSGVSVAPAIEADELATDTEMETADDVATAIRRANDRDRVGDLIVGAFERCFKGALDAGVVFVIRDPVAIGWKGFIRGRGSSPLDHIAVPLTARSSLLPPYLDKVPYVGPPPDGGTRLDRRLWRAVHAPPPETIAVAPVEVEGHVICLLYAQCAADDALAPLHWESVVRLAGAASTAFTRLIRAAQR